MPFSIRQDAYLVEPEVIYDFSDYFSYEITNGDVVENSWIYIIDTLTDDYELVGATHFVIGIPFEPGHPYYNPTPGSRYTQIRVALYEIQDSGLSPNDISGELLTDGQFQVFGGTTNPNTGEITVTIHYASNVYLAGDDLRTFTISSWDLTVVPSALFTAADDWVDFNDLTVGQSQLFSLLGPATNPAFMYYGLGGDDVVRLPDSNVSLVGGLFEWNELVPFFGGGGNDTVTGGDRDDRFLSSTGEDRLSGGDGTDTFIYTNFQGWPQAYTQYLDGGSHPGATDGGLQQRGDLLELPGSIEDYTFWYSSTGLVTTLTYGPNGPTEFVLSTTGIERATFEQLLEGGAEQADNNYHIEAASLAGFAYDFGASSASGWIPVQAMQLGILNRGQHSNSSYSFQNGWYESVGATAFVGQGMYDGERTLLISFTGTDEVSDATSGWLQYDDYYGLFAPLLDGLETFLQESGSQYSQILVTGHSLGGAMVQEFLNSFALPSGINVLAQTIGSPGAFSSGGVFAATNFVHLDDIVPRASRLAPRDGSDVVLNVQSAGHSSATYALTIDALINFASKFNNPFFWGTDLAQSLRDGTPYSGPDIQIAFGNPSNPGNIVIHPLDDYVLGSFYNDTIDFLLPANQLKVIDPILIYGDGGTDTLRLTGSASDWTWTIGSPITILKSASGIEKARLASIEKLVFTGTGQVATLQDYVLDGPKAAATSTDPIVVYLDGRQTSIQTPDAPGPVILDPNADWFEAGAGNYEIAGSLADDIVVLGDGTQDVAAGAGDDLIMFRDIAPSASSSYRLEGGAGDDTLIGLAGGQITAVFSGASSDYEVSALADGSYRISDLRAGVPDGTDTLYNIEFLSFADGEFHVTEVVGANQSGSDGNDTFYGAARNDFFIGWAGNDVFFLQDGGNDSAIGGTGDDIFRMGGTLNSLDEIEGGFGHDTLVLSGTTSTSAYGNVRGIETIILESGASLGQDFTYRLYWWSDEGGPQQRLLVDGSALGPAEWMEFDAYGDPNRQFDLRGGAAADTLIGGDGIDFLTGGGGNDWLEGAGGIDIAIFAGAQSDYDITEVGGGEFLVVGPDGSDTVYSVEYLRFDDGIVALIPQGSNPGVTLSGGASDEELVGTNLNDFILGFGGNDIIRSEGGADYLDGGMGDDIYYVLDQESLILESEGAGHDRVVTQANQFVLPDHVEELVSVGGGRILATGNAGDNRIFGGPQNDMIAGLAGADSLYGGGGIDVFVFAPGDGADLIGDFDPQTDLIDLSAHGFRNFASLDIQQAATSVIIDLGGGDLIELANLQLADLTQANIRFTPVDPEEFAGTLEEPLIDALVHGPREGIQVEPEVVPLANGQFVIVWRDTTNEIDGVIYGRSNRGHLVAQIFDADGTPSGPVIDIDDAEGLATNIKYFDVAALSSGGFVVVFGDANPDDDRGAIYAQYFDANGAAQSGPILVNQFMVGEQGQPRVAELSDGNVVVTWVSADPNLPQANLGSAPRTLVARLLDQAGNFVSDETFLASGIFSYGGGYWAGQTHNPEILALEDGGFIVSYLWVNGDVRGLLFTQHHQNDLTWIGTNQIYSSTYGDGLFRPWEPEPPEIYAIEGVSMTELADGRIAIAFAENGFQFQSNDVFDIAVAFLTPENGYYDYDETETFQVNEDYLSEQQRPAIQALPNGNFVVFWSDDNPWRDTIRYREFDASGNPIGEERQLGSTTFESEIPWANFPGYYIDSGLWQGLHRPYVALLENGRLVVTYGDLDDVAGPDLGSVYFSILTDGGDGLPYNPLPEENTIYGTSDGEMLSGTAGRDILIGGDGDDVLQGNGGDDYLEGGEGIDFLIGGRGRDAYLVSPGDIIIEEFNQGSDVVGARFSYTLPENVERLILLDEAGEATGTGNSLDNFIRGNDARNTLHGLAGDDILEGGGLRDDLYGGAGADQLIGEEGNDVLFGGDGDDYLSGSWGHDTIFGGGGNDTAYGHEHDDYIDGGDGDDILDGGDSNDTASYASASAAVSVSLTLQDTAQDTGGAGIDILRNFENLFGSAYGDTLTGDDSANVLEGSGGNDILNGGAGNDRLIGGAGWDTLEGGSGADSLEGGAGRDTANYVSAITGVTVSLALAGAAQDTVGAGLDTLIAIENLRGSDFADTLTGDVGANYLWGGGAADTIYGGGGSDLLVGEDGDDTLYGESGWDNMRGDDGNDTLWGGFGGDLMKGNAGNDTFYGGDGYDRVYGGNDNDTAWGGADTDDLYGQAGDDTLYGEDGDDLLQGNNGADMLDGGADNDSLDGGSGNDTLLGGEGDDVLTGSWGIDTLTGGAGADTFAFASGHTGRWEGNADIITDFSQSDGDLIDLSAFDADSSTGSDDAFTFIGDAAFSGTAGELRYSSDGTRTLVEGDTDGDGVADFAIVLDGDIALQGADFVL